MAELISTAKYGATSYAMVSGVSIESAENSGLTARVEDAGVIRIAYTNKREFLKIHDLIDSANTVVKSEPVATGTRKIVLLDTAINDGLEHGKSWTATLYDIDKNGLNPEWDGRQICYIYY